MLHWRVREKKATAAQTLVIPAGEKPDNSEAIAAREARKAQARARQAEKQKLPSRKRASITRKAAVEAAIARAKARKAGQQDVVVEKDAEDPRKAAVEAAIARAKARKQLQRRKLRSPKCWLILAKPLSKPLSLGPARKAAQQEEQPQAANDDPRKVAVAAAIARVQAKKAAQQAVNED